MLQPSASRCCAIAMMALFGMVILLPIYLQTVRGMGLAADRAAAAARRPADGSARPARRPALRPVRAAGADRDRVPWCWSGDVAAQHRSTAPRRSGCCSLMHVLLSIGLAFLFTPALHHRPQPAAAAPLLARQRDPDHAAAGRRRGRDRAAGRDHGSAARATLAASGDRRRADASLGGIHAGVPGRRADLPSRGWCCAAFMRNPRASRATESTASEPAGAAPGSAPLSAAAS